MLYKDEGLQSIIILNNIKIYMSQELENICEIADVLLTRLLSYFCDYNSIKISFALLKR